MEILALYGPHIARILLSFVFLYSGIEKILRFRETQVYMVSAGMPMTAFFLVLAILIDLGGGLSVLFGYYDTIGAFILILYTIIATAIFHRHIGDQLQMILFSKNLAIIGGLLLLILSGQ